MTTLLSNLSHSLLFFVKRLLARVQPRLESRALTIGGGFYAWFNPKSRAVSIEVATELMRVTWPTWEETRISTVAVVIASLVAALILFGIDSFSYKVMVDWLPSLWSRL